MVVVVVSNNQFSGLSKILVSRNERRCRRLCTVKILDTYTDSDPPSRVQVHVLVHPDLDNKKKYVGHPRVSTRDVSVKKRYMQISNKILISR